MIDDAAVEAAARVIAAHTIEPEAFTEDEWRNHLGTARAALEAAEAARWRPIETAPKDGTWVLLGYFSLPGQDGIFVGFWHDREKAWTDTHHMRSRDLNWQPTHWRPLPPQPQGA